MNWIIFASVWLATGLFVGGWADAKDWKDWAFVVALAPVAVWVSLGAALRIAVGKE